MALSGIDVPCRTLPGLQLTDDIFRKCHIRIGGVLSLNP